MGVGLHPDGQGAVCSAPLRAADALRNFFLHHENSAFPIAAFFHYVPDKERGNVIGQVSYQFPAWPIGQAIPVKIHDIHMPNLCIAIFHPLIRPVLVFFNEEQAFMGNHAQGFRQSSSTRPYFQDLVCLAWH